MITVYYEDNKFRIDLIRTFGLSSPQLEFFERMETALADGQSSISWRDVKIKRLEKELADLQLK